MRLPIMSLDADVSPLPKFNEQMYSEVVAGLQSDPPEISAKYLYDDRGSELFGQICDLEEYYLTDKELELIRTHGADIAARVGSRARLVELGAGSGAKTRVLLEHLHELAAYVPVDISAKQLQQCAGLVGCTDARFEVLPVCADYTSQWELPKNGFDGRTVFFYPGSTIGNFHPGEARRFLGRLARRGGPRSAMVIGVDLDKDPEIIEAAYNDSRGVTAQFILNVLRRINRECGADFQRHNFAYRGIYQQQEQRIQARLLSRCKQTVNFPDTSFEFDEEDWIVAEYSYKYTIEGFAELAEEANWRTRAIWTDDEQMFSLWYLEVE